VIRSLHRHRPRWHPPRPDQPAGGPRPPKPASHPIKTDSW